MHILRYCALYERSNPPFPFSFQAFEPLSMRTPNANAPHQLANEGATEFTTYEDEVFSL